MTTRPGSGRWSVLDRSSRALAALSVVTLIWMMGVIFVAVLMRYALNAPILGANEIVQMSSVALVMLALPFATQTETHVRVDVLDNWIGRYGRFLGDLVARGLAIFVLSVLVRRTWQRLWDAYEFEDATNMLDVPYWPFYGLIALGMALNVAVLVAQAVDGLLRGPATNE